MVKVSDAIHYAHQQGIIHRDIKPANIMITKDGEPLVMDFGLAKVTTDEQLSKTGDVIGTPAYMSPEQAQGLDIDKTTDVYALGATLYEILVGRAPFQGETYFKIIIQIVENDPISPKILNPEVPVELEAICLKCLEKKLEKRYSNVKTLSKDLNSFLNHRPITAKKPTIITIAKKFILRNKVLTIATAMVFLSLLLGGLFSFSQWQIVQIQKRDISMRLAKIAFAKAHELAHKNEWEKAGVLAGESFGFINNLQDSKANRLKKRSRFLINTARQNFGNLWLNIVPTGFVGVDYSPDGKIVATASIDNLVRLWEAKTGILLQKLQGHSDEVFRVCFSPNGKFLASCSKDTTIKVWSVKSKKLLKTLKGHTKEIWHTAFSPNSKTIASASFDNTVKIWDIDSGKLLKTLKKHTNNVRTIAFSPDGKWIASGTDNRNLEIWEVKTGKKIREIKEISTIGVRFSNNGKLLATVSRRSRAKLWDHMGKHIRTLDKQFAGGGNAICFSPDDKIIAISSLHNIIKLHSVDTGEIISKFKGHSKAIYALKFSPDGKILASSAQDIKLWKTNGQLIQVLKGHQDTVFALDFSPNGKFLASASGDKSVKLWDVQTGCLVQTFYGNYYFECVTRFSPDGNTIASTESHLKLWDISRYREQKVPFFINGNNVPNQKVERMIDTNPKLITEFLFGREVTEQLKVEPLRYKKFLQRLKKSLK